MRLGDWRPVKRAPTEIQDLGATSDLLVAITARAGSTSVLVWNRLDAAPRMACTLPGFATSLKVVPGGESVAVRVQPDWPFLPDGEPLGMMFDDADPPEIFERKRVALAALGTDTRLMLVDLVNGTASELARSTPAFHVGDVVFSPDGASLALSGCRKVDGTWMWSTRMIDVTTGEIRAEYSLSDEAICPHTWDARGLVLYSRIHRQPRSMFRVVAERVTPFEPDGVTSPDGAYLVRITDGRLAVSGLDGVVRDVPAGSLLAQRALRALGTLPSGLQIEGSAWWWGPRRLVIGGLEPFVLDVTTSSFARLLPGETDRHPVGCASGSWLVAYLDGKLRWCEPDPILAL